MNRDQLQNDAEQAMRLVLDGRQSTLWTAMPGIVQSVDFEKMTCSVQPTIQGTVENEDGTYQTVNLPVLVDVPIVFPSAGGFIITMPLAQNDEVLVVFASRCIDAWWQSGGIQRPMEARMHDLSDGFAIPGPRSQPRIPGGAISSTGVQIRNDAGTSYVEISADGKVKLVAPAEIDITAPAIMLNGAVTVSGALAAASIAAAGGISGAGGVNLATHKHAVTTAPGTTGVPVP